MDVEEFIKRIDDAKTHNSLDEVCIVALKLCKEVRKLRDENQELKERIDMLLAIVDDNDL